MALRNHQFQQLNQIDSENVRFQISTDARKTSISMHLHPNGAEIAFVSPACVTHWPRCTGDGNFGTMWGPTDPFKAKFSLDLTDSEINGAPNTGFTMLSALLNNVDDKLLEFVFQNQLKVLGRKNLSKEECKMLQIRSVRAKYDKNSGAQSGNSLQLSTPKYTWDGVGGRFARQINVCDHAGAVLPSGTVSPGDAVAATIYAAQVYTGVGGDKFGVQWSFEDVSIVAQRSQLQQVSQVSFFSCQSYDFSTPYVAPVFSEETPA